MISTEGIAIGPVKVQAVMDWKHPTTPVEVQSFLGLVGYYHKNIWGFSSAATNLTRKNVIFLWTLDCENAFWELKKLLTMAPILTISLAGGKLMIFIDSSHSGLICVLMQNEKVVAYIFGSSRPCNSCFCS